MADLGVKSTLLTPSTLSMVALNVTQEVSNEAKNALMDVAATLTIESKKY